MRISRSSGLTISLHILCLLSTLGIGIAQTDFITTPTYQSNGSWAWPNQKAIAVGSDGFVRFVTGDSSSGGSGDAITFVRCLDEDCSTWNTKTFTTGNDTFADSMALGPDGFARIVYSVFGGPNVIRPHESALGLIQCADADCTSFSNTVVDGASDNAVSSVVVGSDGTARVIYDDGDDSCEIPGDPDREDSQGVGLATCNGGSCSTTHIVSIDCHSIILGAITMGSDGNPVLVYEDSGSVNQGTSPSVHYYVNGTNTVVSSDASSCCAIDVTLAPDGFGRIVFPKADESGVDFIRCTDTSCSAPNITTISSPRTDGVSVVIPTDGTADIESAALDYVSCTNADCSSYNDEAISGNWNGVVSLALGLDGFPRMMAQDIDSVVYQDRKPKLSCTSPVTRDGITTCTVTGVTVAGWKFEDGSGSSVTRSTNTTSLTWSGAMVTSGTVSVTVSGITNPLTANVTVNPRTNFAFTAAQPQKEGNPYTCVSAGGSEAIEVNNPPQSQNGSDAIGKYCDIEDASYEPASISDDGPNNGYSYVLSATNNASFHWIIAPDAENSSTDFYQAQCGNYNPSTNAGFISGVQLDANTVRHESGTVHGHYGNYVTIQNNSNNNVGTGLESAVNFSSGTTFQNWVKSYIAPRMTALHNGTRSPEPYDVNHDQNGVYDGPINFLPYAPCQ
jgi:hypothetical protein